MIPLTCSIQGANLPLVAQGKALIMDGVQTVQYFLLNIHFCVYTFVVQYYTLKHKINIYDTLRTVTIASLIVIMFNIMFR